MTPDEREKACVKLTDLAVDFIIKRLGGIEDVGWRGTSNLKNEIYGWLQDHALFDEEVE